MKTNLISERYSFCLTKLFFIILLFFILNQNANAQIVYSYDANGNRTEQKVYSSHAPTHHNNNSTGSDSTKVIVLKQGNDSIQAMAFKQGNDTNKAIATKYGITVYPNPTTGQVYVSISSLQTCGFAMVYLTDAAGNELSAQKATSSPVYISLASYKQGEYYIRIALCGDEVYYKVVKVAR